MADLETPDRGPPKPAFGQACNGCGYCCAAEPCGIALEYISPHLAGPCPALEFEDGRFHCGMVRRPGLYMSLPNDWADAFLGPLFARMLGVGKGCCADDLGSFGSLRGSGVDPGATSPNGGSPVA